MGNTLITFGGKYWEYGGVPDVYEKGLTIGGYESAFLADLVAAYILENTQQFFDEAKFDGIYRDDGLVVFNGKKSTAGLKTGSTTNSKQKLINCFCSTIYHGYMGRR